MYFALVHRTHSLEIVHLPGITLEQASRIAGVVKLPTLGYGPQWRDLRLVYDQDGDRLAREYKRAVVTHQGRIRSKSKHPHSAELGLADTLKALVGLLADAHAAGHAAGKVEGRRELGREITQARREVDARLARLDDGEHGPADDQGRRDRWGVQLTDEQFNGIAAHVRDGRKINAIKDARMACPHLGLKEAKDWVEAHWSDMGGPPPMY